MVEVLPGKIILYSLHLSWLSREETIIYLTTMYLKLGNTQKYVVPILKPLQSLGLVSRKYVLLLQLSVYFISYFLS
jgi:hypothetical protein